MLKMVIKFDEKKVEENGFSLPQINAYLNEFVSERNLVCCEEGVYTDNGNEDDDTFSFMVIASVLSKKEWMKCASEWSWYENSDIPDDLIKKFELAA